MSAVWAVNEVYKYQMHWSFDAPCHLGTFCEVRLKLRITTWSMNVRLCDKCERYWKISSKATRQLQNKSIMNLFVKCNDRLMIHDSWEWLSWCFKVCQTHFQRHMKHVPLFECQGRKTWSKSICQLSQLSLKCINPKCSGHLMHCAIWKLFLRCDWCSQGRLQHAMKHECSFLSFKCERYHQRRCGSCKISHT